MSVRPRKSLETFSVSKFVDSVVISSYGVAVVQVLNCCTPGGRATTKTEPGNTSRSQTVGSHRPGLARRYHDGCRLNTACRQSNDRPVGHHSALNTASDLTQEGHIVCEYQPPIASECRLCVGQGRRKALPATQNASRIFSWGGGQK